MRDKKMLILCCPLLLALLVAGCSKIPEGRAEVTGKIAVDGVPPKNGAITFSPVDGKSPTSGGKIVNGEYTVVASVGLSEIAVRVPKVLGKKKLYDTPDSPVQTVKGESLPSKYNDETELTFEVVPGKNTCDFDLSTN